MVGSVQGAFERVTGVVAAFEEDRGLGAVRSDTGEELPFHCTAIADGTRTIPEGVRVRYGVVPGRAGRWEATAIERAGEGLS